MGEKAIARFEQDVLSQPGVDAVIVLLGINDIGWPGSAFAPREAPATADAMIAGYRKLIAAAHARQVRIIGGTLLPFEGALQGTPYDGHFSPAKDAVRREVNEWIRNSGEFDAVLDCVPNSTPVTTCTLVTRDMPKWRASAGGCSNNNSNVVGDMNAWGASRIQYGDAIQASNFPRSPYHARCRARGTTVQRGPNW
jgi:hypothetical protein